MIERLINKSKMDLNQRSDGIPALLPTLGVFSLDLGLFLTGAAFFLSGLGHEPRLDPPVLTAKRNL